MLLSDAEERRLLTGAARSLPAEYNRAVDGLEIEEGAGSCGTAAFRREPVIVTDVMRDPLWKNYRDLARLYGFGACWSYPVLAPDGKLLGTFAVYFPQPRAPVESELSLLASSARVAGIAIYRKKMEEARRKSEAEFQRLANSVPQIVFVTAADGQVIFVNERWKEFSGLTLEETSDPEIVAGAIHPDDRERVFAEWTKAFAAGRPYEVEGRIRNRLSGEYRWFLMRSQAFRSEADEIVQWFGTSTDITATKEAESRTALLIAVNELTRQYERADDLLFAVSKAVGEHFHARRCLFNEIDLENDLETVHRDYCRGVESVVGRHKITDYSAVTTAEMMAGKTVVNRDSRIDPRTADLYETQYRQNGERAYVAVPLLREKRWVASLWLSDDRPRPWSPEEVSLLETIAEKTWAVVEKLRIDEALRESEEKFRHLADNMSQLAWMAGAAGDVFWYNRRWYDYTGDTSAEMNGGEWQRALHPDSAGEVKKRFFASMAADREWEDTFQLRSRSGEYRWFLARAVPIRGADGRIFRWFGTNTDVTELRNTKRELEEANALLDTLFDQAPVGLGYWDKNLRLARVNRALAEMNGFRVEDQLGKPVTEILPNVEASITEAFRRVLETGEATVNFEAQGRAADGAGDARFWNVSYYPINLGGRIEGVGAVCEEITERKKAEAMREKLLASEQEARLQAENANRLKDEFLATVSHELRTPLNAMLGWATIVREAGYEPEMMRRAFEIVERNARHQQQIIADILDVSRIITGKLSIAAESIELAPVVEAAIDTVRPAIEAKNIDLLTEFEESVGPIRGDASRLQQVVWNLLSNAVKFTPENGSIVVSLRRCDRHSVEIAIRDDGEGIEPEFLPYVFDRFRQADGATNRRHGGLGLGLAIVRHLVELHGGRVEAASDGKGCGAAFTVRLPLARAAAGEKTSAPSVSGAAANRSTATAKLLAGRKQTLDGRRLLVVDNEEDALELIKIMLEARGAEIVTASSAAEALEMLGRTRFDCLISDLGMPDKDGFDLIRAVRAAPDLAAIPAIAVTAYASEADKRRALREGFEAHLSKPVSGEELSQVVEKLLAAK